MIKLSFLGDIMCLKAQNDAVMKKHGEYRYDMGICLVWHLC